MSIKRLPTLCLAFCFLSFLLAGAEIHDAALNGDLAKVKELLAKDPALLAAGNDLGRTPLHLAAHRGHLELAAWLIGQGADVNGRETSYRLSPLHMAVWGGHLEVARLLLKKGADIQAREKDNETALYYVGNSLPLAKFLVTKGLKINDTKSSAGNTPLAIALQRGNLEMAEYFLTGGADALYKDREGSTTLHMACWRGKKGLIELLLKKGVPVDASDNAGWTPLLLATIMGNQEAVNVLLAHKANVNIKNQNGLFPLFQAAKDGKKEIALRLLASGARAGDCMGDTGMTSLHMACALGYGDIAKALLDKGADVNSKDKWDHTPLGLAGRYGHTHIVEFLLTRGAAVEKSVVESADSSWLKKPLAQGEALVWYTEQSGWAVRTANHFLVFDYYKPDPAPDQPGLANGWIVPAQIKDLPVTVFISHSHEDHYSPAVFDWKKEIKDITYITGFNPEGKDGYIVLPPHEKKDLNGMEIIAIESNDSGQGYFIKVDGVSIFHPGDHANRQRDFSGPFTKEIDTLADLGLKADILFTPVSGCGFGDIIAVKKGAYYTMDRLSARYVFPMHAQGNPLQYHSFAKEAKDRGYDNLFCCPEFPGDCFAVKPSENK
jgi:ankyrin repeat protein/L-ascorbate metabolism protein UlaG (beta-lactamase superfamily)